jgi:hypothetical protein
VRQLVLSSPVPEPVAKATTCGWPGSWELIRDALAVLADPTRM